MMKKISLLVFFLCGMFLTAWTQNAPTEGLITHGSRYTAEETVERLKSAIEEMGLSVIAEVNHGQAAASKGLALWPTYLLLFGNPKVGTKLMQADRRSGLDLPLRMLVWQNEQGEALVTYHNPQSLFSLYQLEGRQEVLQKMQGVMEKLVQQLNREEE